MAAGHPTGRPRDARIPGPLDAPLGLLGRSLLLSVLGFAEGLGKTVPRIEPDDTLTGGQAIAIGQETLGDIFPAMRD